MSSVQETSTDAETADAGGLTENEAATSSGPEATSSTSGSAPIGTEPSLSNGTEASESAEDADSQTSTTFASIPCFVAREETDDTPPVPLLYRTIPKDKSQAKPPKTKKGQQKKQQRAGRPKKISPKARYGKDGKVDNKTKINRWRVDVMLPPMSP
ncbi:hypothetical protein B0T17DRAFT_516044 [Bombardia bombarda]|uniref:Uncharacterized protein n=1 Tax=Bombardia bombarda TaxID=252184 RepID=A0AA39XKL2_9PEZI|nr:hypothetical protein B0T17DRAFT_516044 [Bombardia bombarda]